MEHRTINQGLKLALLTFVAVALTACGDSSSDSGVDEEPDPAANGTAIWNHLQEENYQANWPLWPDTEELYEGTEPHGMLLTIYLNDTAYDAVMNGQSPLPNGSIIVKENYMPDSTLAALTTMYKVDDFNPDANDWFWLRNNPEGMVDAEGIVESCQNCHAGAENDYIFTEFPEGTASVLMQSLPGEENLQTDIAVSELAHNHASSPVSVDEARLIKKWIDSEQK